MRAEDFAQSYQAAANSELISLSEKVQSLVPEASSALRAEMECRHLPIENVDWTSKSNPVALDQGPKWAGKFFRHFGVFILCWIVESFLFLAVASQVPGLDIEKMSASLTRVALNASLLMAFVTGRYWVPKSMKTTWFIGFAMPLLVFGLEILIY